MKQLNSEQLNLLQVAREAIASKLENRLLASSDFVHGQKKSQGVFVTLYTHMKELRGCIGHISPVCASLSEEVAECAVAAAFEDPRFPPLSISELSSVHLEISLLGPLSEVETVNELDPKRFGVVVSAGWRRGLLLPDIDGVDSVDMQIDIARRKAGIAAHERVKIQKFEVNKISELV